MTYGEVFAFVGCVAALMGVQSLSFKHYVDAKVDPLTKLIDAALTSLADIRKELTHIRERLARIETHLHIPKDDAA